MASEAKKNLIVSIYFAPELGAAPSRITNMAEGLHADGMEVDVLTSLPNYPKGRIFEGYRRRFSKREVRNGINLFRYWTFATVSKNPLLRILGMLSFSLMLWFFAWRIRRIRRYDLVIVQSPPIMVAHSAMCLFAKLFRKKVVLNVSDLWPMSAVDLGAVREGSFYYKILLAMERFIYRNAAAIQGQSDEILRHIRSFEPQKPLFLYRNLQRTNAILPPTTVRTRNGNFNLVYAGLLGVAQDLYSLITSIDFKALGAELHLYGGGNQTGQIEEYISTHDVGVFYLGYIPIEQMADELRRYDASIVPLAVHIKGAVPSKIFDLLPVGVPILLCGSGEAAEIVEQYGVGYTSAPKDYVALAENIRRMKALSAEHYQEMKENCHKAAAGDFSFRAQMKRYIEFLRTL